MPLHALYAAARDRLLDSPGKTYYLFNCFEQLSDTKSGQSNPLGLVRRTGRIFLLYEAAKMSAASKMHPFLEVSATHAAWFYYKRLPPALRKVMERASN